MTEKFHGTVCFGKHDCLGHREHKVSAALFSLSACVEARTTGLSLVSMTSSHVKIEKFQLKKNKNNVNISLIVPQNVDCGYMLEKPSRRGSSNEYPQSMFWIKNNCIHLYTTVLLY